MSPFILQTFCTHCLCSHIYFLCSHNKQLNGDLKGITFVVTAVHEQIALMSSSQSKTRLLLYVHEQFAMPLHLLCSTILYIYTYIYSWIGISYEAQNCYICSQWSYQRYKSPLNDLKKFIDLIRRQFGAGQKWSFWCGFNLAQLKILNLARI